MTAARFLAPTDEPAREFLFECAVSPEPRHRMNAANVLVNLHYEIEDQADWIMPRLSALAMEGKFDPVEEPFNPTRTWPEEDKRDHQHDVYSRFSYRLTFWKDPRAADVLIRCVEKGIAVGHAADSLGSIGDTRAVPSLQAWFQTRKSPQDEVIAALSKLGCREIAPELTRRLFVEIAPAQPSIGSHEMMILALKDLDAREAVPEIERFLVEHSKKESAAAASPAPLVAASKIDDTEFACKRALAVLKDTEPVTSLLQMLNSEDDDFRKGDLIADLTSFPGARVETRLVELAQHDENLNVRWRALRGLAQMKTQSSLLLVASHLEFTFPPLKEGLPKGVLHRTDQQATAFMREKIVAMLNKVTGQQFGQDKAAWEKWIREEFPKSASAKK
jgi:hypothetical protein